MPAPHPRRTFSAVTMSVALVVVACGQADAPKPGGTSDQPPAASGGSASALTGAGATFPNPLYTKWFDTYNKQTSVRINYQSIGSGGGIRQFTEGTVDFGATDGPMTDEQIAAVKGNVVHFPTVLGADVLTYNLPSLAGTPLKLDGTVVANIFLGDVRQWDDPQIAALNPGVKLPHEDIIVVHRSDGSGTTYIFTDYLSKVSPAWRERVGKATSVNWPTGLGAKGNEGVTQQIKQSAGGLGYVELIYAHSNNLPVAQIRNAAGRFVTPTLESITAAAAGTSWSPDTDFRVSITDAKGPDAYPIASFTWLLVPQDARDPVKASALRDFVSWMITPEAQKIAGDLLYAPLPTEVVRLVEAKLPTLKAGGKPLPGGNP